MNITEQAREAAEKEIQTQKRFESHKELEPYMGHFVQLLLDAVVAEYEKRAKVFATVADNEKKARIKAENDAKDWREIAEELAYQLRDRQTMLLGHDPKGCPCSPCQTLARYEEKVKGQQ